MKIEKYNSHGGHYDVKTTDKLSVFPYFISIY